MNSKLRKAALGAAFFIAGCSSLAPQEKPTLHAADEAAQRLYDQAVKLHRRYASQANAPLEPLHSILLELVNFHDQEQASYLSDLAPSDKRSGPVDLAPWAQQQLALLSLQRKDFQAAAEQFQSLGEHFEGRMIVEPSDAAPSKENAGPAALCGEISSILEIAKLSGAKDLVTGLNPKIKSLQEKYGSETAPCNPVCDSYSRKALRALWEALALEKADFQTWLTASRDFVENEKSSDLRAEIWVALGEGSAKLGKTKEAAECFTRAAKLRGDAKEHYQKDEFKPGEMLFGNLLNLK